MRGAPVRGLWVGFAVLLVVFAGVGVYAVNSIQATRETLEETGETGRGRRGLRDEGERGRHRGCHPRLREDGRPGRPREGGGKAGFEESRARHEDLLGARADEGRGARIEAHYRDYAALSESLMDGNDEQRAANDRVGEGFAGVRNILGEQSRAGVNARGPDRLQKSREAASMSGAIAGFEGSLRDHLRNRARSPGPRLTQRRRLPRGPRTIRLTRILDETGLDPNYLELTESLLMEDIAVSSAMLDELRVFMGLRLSVDDFGTGYSSLSYLARLPVDALKIDRSFIMTMEDQAESMTIVSTIISLAHALRLTVIAEGVELEEQAKLLRLLNCDQAQGYLFSRPLPWSACFDGA
jgi:hypothetical protein